MKNDDLWLIFGCSPFIGKVKNIIPALLKKYHSVGVNYFPVFFPGCEYWLFNDSGIFSNLVVPNYSNQKLIINKNLESELKTVWINKNNCFIQNNFIIKPYYVFENVVDNPVLVQNGKLFGSYTSVLNAINYALIQNAKSVVLIGVDFNPSWKHFYFGKSVSKPLNELKFIKDQLIKFMPYLKLYNGNKYSALNLEYINIRKLLRKGVSYV